MRFPALMVALAVMIGVLTTTFLRAAGLQRQRVRWVFWSTIIGFSGVVVWLIVPAYRAAVLTSVVITIGYAYAILRHRVIDVGFVINRAIVFTIVTSAVFAIFALVSTTVERLTPNESIGVQSIVAIALAFSFDFGYKRVETVIGRLFFRAKRNAEVALRRFMDDARSVRSVSVLLERALAVACDCWRARSACVYREHAGVYGLAAARGAAVFPESIDATDPTFAALRANENEIDLGDIGGALTGDGYAFPLAARKGMMGALIVRARPNAEAYDPEERSLIRALAREVAAGMQAISEADHIEFIEQVAAGNLDAHATQARARALIEKDF